LGDSPEGPTGSDTGATSGIHEVTWLSTPVDIRVESYMIVVSRGRGPMKSLVRAISLIQDEGTRGVVGGREGGVVGIGRPGPP